MSKLPVIAVFDIGKTNKKCLLFNHAYQVVYEESMQFPELPDEDGFPCDDVIAFTGWIESMFESLLEDHRFEVKGVNFSGYGASFVFLDDAGLVIPPLYNYLKPFDPALQKQFYKKYGGEPEFSRETASPVLGNLNSGMQLYRIQHERPELFREIAVALHLPQYLAFILSRAQYSDLTSIGCHTNLWSFSHDSYHRWVAEEGISGKLAPIVASSGLSGYTSNGLPVGVGLHDSSAALIPYLRCFSEPFVLLSTGTWSITLNPFNSRPLTEAELRQDCLCYLSYTGHAVKASRLFAGHEHEEQARRLAEHFQVAPDAFKGVRYDESLVDVTELRVSDHSSLIPVTDSVFSARDLTTFQSYEHAYHRLIADLVAQQVLSTGLVLSPDIRNLFVDGGFSRNAVFMNLLAAAYPNIHVSAASVPQASALGAALAMHEYWNEQPLPANLVTLRPFGVRQPTG